MPTAITKPYDSVKSAFQPLDLLLFRGTDIISDTIRVVERAETGDGDFSHCGILVNKDLLPTVSQLEPGKWYVWESTFTAIDGFLSKFSDGTPDVKGKGKFGVQIRDFESVVSTYTKVGGSVAWAPLSPNPWLVEGQRKKLSERASSLHDVVGNRVYDASCLSLFAVAFPCLRKPRDLFNELMTPHGPLLVSWNPTADDDDNINPNEIAAVEPGNNSISGWLFCSELVALVYQKIGLIDKKFDPQDVMPVDFFGVHHRGLPRLVQDPTYLVASS